MKQGPKSNGPPPPVSGYHVPVLCLGISLISVLHVIRPAFSEPLNLSYSPEQRSH